MCRKFDSCRGYSINRRILGNYARCPFSFFATYLKIKAYPETPAHLINFITDTLQWALNFLSPIGGNCSHYVHTLNRRRQIKAINLFCPKCKSSLSDYHFFAIPRATPAHLKHIVPNGVPFFISLTHRHFGSSSHWWDLFM